MKDETVINGLVSKRAELAGEIEHTEAKLHTLLADVGSLDAAIWVFNPDYKVEGIKAKRFQTRKQTGRGEMSRAIFEILRQASEPLTTREVSEHVAPGANTAELKHVVKRVGLALHRQKERGAVLADKVEGREMVWKLETN
jgi:hypothetical protein